MQLTKGNLCRGFVLTSKKIFDKIYQETFFKKKLYYRVRRVGSDFISQADCNIFKLMIFQFHLTYLKPSTVF